MRTRTAAAALKASTKAVIGVDLGGTNFKVAWFDERGAVRADDTRPSRVHRAAGEVLDEVAASVLAIVEKAEAVGAAVGMIGVGIPAVIEPRSQKVLLLPNFSRSFQGLALALALQSRIKRPVRLINDARAFALAEWRFGSGQGVANLLAITVGTGVGGGLILDGRLRLGPHHTAGEFGHIVIAPHGVRCGCGSIGCIETIASGPAIVAAAARPLLQGRAPVLREIVGGALERLTADRVVQAARNGDEDCLEIMRDVGGALGLAIANVAKVVDVERVAIGGGVAAAGDVLFDPVRESLKANAHVLGESLPDVLAATAKLAGAHGAAIWAMEGRE